MADSRLIATMIVQDILENKVFAPEAKASYESEIGSDSAFINMLTQTSLRRLVIIKRILKRYIHKRLPAKSTLAYYALILGTAEILWLDTPDYAVINSYVELVKKKLDKFVAGFVNAVLRKIVANKETLQNLPDDDYFPSEFRKILNNSYGKKTIRKIEQSFLQEPLLDLSCKPDSQGWAQKLGAIELPLGSLRLNNQGNITKLDGYSAGAWWVQDFAASLPVKMLNSNLKGQKVLDLCAAPGGKTAQLLAADADVTALDISSARLARLQENINRLNLPQPQIICQDAITYLQNLDKPLFDIVLLDAPCSATGTLRRHPELIHTKNLGDVTALAAVQKEILELISRALKTQGTLIYCTCSLAKEEGEYQISEFLQQHPEFKLRPLTVPQEIAEIITPQGYIRTLPHHLAKFGGCDGFFVAALCKG